MEKTINEEIKIVDFNNLPIGTIVYLDNLHIPLLIYADYITIGDTKKDYLSAMLPGGLIQDDLGTAFNAEYIKEVIYLGTNSYNLTVLEGKIPEKFLPVGSIVNLLVEKNITINGEKGNIYTNDFMIIGYNPKTKNGKMYDYILVEILKTHGSREEIVYLNVNHYEIKKILYIPKELEISKCFRMELVKLKVMTHEMPQESIERIKNCADNS